MDQGGSDIRDSGPGTRDSGFGPRDSGLGSRDSGLGTRDSGFGIRSSGFPVRAGFGVPGSCWVPGFRVKCQGPVASAFRRRFRAPATCHALRATCDVRRCPRSSVARPESRVPSPESRVPSPSPELPSPESRVPSPESRVRARPSGNFLCSRDIRASAGDERWPARSAAGRRPWPRPRTAAPAGPRPPCGLGCVPSLSAKHSKHRVPPCVWVAARHVYFPSVVRSIASSRSSARRAFICAWRRRVSSTLYLPGPLRTPPGQRQAQPRAPARIHRCRGRGFSEIERPSQRSVEASHAAQSPGPDLPDRPRAVIPAVEPTRKEGCDRGGQKPGTRDSGFGARGSGLGARGSGLGARDSGLGTRDSGLGTRDSGLGIRDSGLGIPARGHRNVPRDERSRAALYLAANGQSTPVARA